MENQMGIKTSYEVQCDICNESTEFIDASSIKQARIVLREQTNWIVTDKKWICPDCSKKCKMTVGKTHCVCGNKLEQNRNETKVYCSAKCRDSMLPRKICPSCKINEMLLGSKRCKKCHNAPPHASGSRWWKQ